MRAIIAALFLFAALPSFAQTACPTAPADPVARDALRLNWSAVTTWVNPPGGNIPTPTQITYSVYRMVGTAATLVCTTTATSAGQFSLPVGDSCYAVTAKTPKSTPANVESARTATICKTIQPEPTTPEAPSGFTITGSIQLNLTVTPTP
jgi:hypothetical protein